VDLLGIVDAARGARRIGGVAAALLLTRPPSGPDATEVLLHYPCRDRNLPRMVSELLGVAAGGVGNVLALTGDPSPTGPYPDHTTVFDLDSIGLVNLVHRLNLGADPGGQGVDPPTRFVVGVAVDPGATDRDRALARFRWKVEAGADFAVTRPVFDPAELFVFLNEVAAPLPVIAGIWPLTSLREAEYLDQEVPGVRVPEAILARMTSVICGFSFSSGDQRALASF
jgi:homocysteine S-methyltransferase